MKKKREEKKKENTRVVFVLYLITEVRVTTEFYPKKDGDLFAIWRRFQSSQNPCQRKTRNLSQHLPPGNSYHSSNIYIFFIVSNLILLLPSGARRT